MNPIVSFYFQVHQPYRLRDLRVTDIGTESIDYFDEQKNRAIFRKVAEKCYLPANALMLDLLKKHPQFHIAYSLSGVFLDQCEEYGLDVLESFQALAATGRVELLGETYHHSLSCLKSAEEFVSQVQLHVQRIQTLFKQTPSVFRNTELIYSNEIAEIARLMGFRGILAEGADHILQGKSPNTPFVPPKFTLHRDTVSMIRKHQPLSTSSNNMHILLKNYRLSDDIAFRFSDRSWVGFPLHADTFTDWILQSGGHCVNLFMDYETFGEHQWEDTGIFEFLRALPALWDKRGIRTMTPSQVINVWTTEDHKEEVFDVHAFVSWADMERDLSAWQGNQIQKAALDSLFAIENDVKQSKNPNLLEHWRKLQTSDHLYYMSTKYWNDGDVHKYFSPYDSPYEAYRRFSHALCDLRERLKHDSKSSTKASLLYT